MSLIDNNDSLSIFPLSVLTTVPVAAGALERIPLGPLVAGRPPTRNGSLSIDSARPCTTVRQLATVITVTAATSATFRGANARYPIGQILEVTADPSPNPGHQSIAHLVHVLLVAGEFLAEHLLLVSDAECEHHHAGD